MGGRVWSLLGSASALYLVADAAQRQAGLSISQWALALAGFLFTLLPWWFAPKGEKPPSGARRVSAMATLLGLAVTTLASGDTDSLINAGVWVLTLPVVGALTLDLALDTPDRLGRVRRIRPLLWLLVAVSIAIGTLSIAPAFELFGELRLVPARGFRWALWLGASATIFALVLRLLRRPLGSAPEALAGNAWGLLALLPTVSILVVLYFESWWPTSAIALRPFVALAGAAICVLGHGALIDPSRRPRAGRSTRGVLAAFGASLLVASISAPIALALGFAGETLSGFWGSWIPFVAVLFGLALVVHRRAQRLSRKLLAPFGGRLLEALEEASKTYGGETEIERVAEHLLLPFRRASASAEARPILWMIDPGREIDLDAAGISRVQSAEVPPSLVERALDAPGEVIVGRDIASRLVRHPELRALGAILEQTDALCALPIARGVELEGILVIPKGRRRSRLTLEEINALRAFAQAAGALLGTIAQRDRAQARIALAERSRMEAHDAADAAEAERDRLRTEAQLLREGRALGRQRSALVAYSPGMRALDEKVQRLASAELPVLILAEAGLPIDRVARRLHAESPRAEEAFVVADCLSVSEEDELFRLFGESGRPGWIQSAGSGSLLLADITALSENAQRQLAETIATRRARTVDGVAFEAQARIIASARFRPRRGFDEELKRWLTRATLRIPPLRERREDFSSIVFLALARACRLHGLESAGISENALRILGQYEWPGNLRELQHVIDLAVAKLATEGENLGRVEEAHLPPLPQTSTRGEDPLVGSYADVERRVLLRALEIAGGNKSQAARDLGLKRTTFLDKLRRLES